MTTIEISDSVAEGDLPLNFVLTGSVSIRNYGRFEVELGVASLLIGADLVDYEGFGATFNNPTGTAIDASSLGPGVSHFSLTDNINAAMGLSVFSTTADIDIEVRSGRIDVSQVAIYASLNNADGRVDIDIASGAVIKGPMPIWIFSDAAATVDIAGRLEGAEGTSYLGNGDTTLVLEPGSFVEGSIDAEGGANRLIWGGAGHGSFDLSEIGSKYIRFQTFQKLGSSAWTFSGTTQHALGLLLDDGTVWLDGSFAESDWTYVGVDGVLGGIGHAANLDVHGTVAPGQGAGTLYAGDVIFHAGSFLEIDSASDRLDVASVDLSGATLRVLPSAGVLDLATIIHSDTPIKTQFAEVVTTSSRYHAEVIYGDFTTGLNATQEPEENSEGGSDGSDGSDGGEGGTGDGGGNSGGGSSGGEVIVVVTPSGKTFAAFARTPAEQKVAAQLDALGTAAPFYAQLDQMSDAEIEAFLSQLAGSDLTSTGEALIKSAGDISAAALGRIQQQGSAVGPSPVLAYGETTADVFDPHPASLWGRLVAGVSSLGGATAGSTTLVSGGDMMFGDDSTLGVLLGVSASTMTSGSTKADSTGLTAGVYGSKRFGDTAFRFVASTGLNLAQSRRRVVGPGVDDSYAATYPAIGVQLLAEAAQAFHLGDITAELFGDLAYAGLATPTYTETGGPAALTVAASWTEAVETTLGTRISRDFAMGTVLATVGGSLGWTHRYAQPTTAVHSFAGSAPFEVTGTAGPGDALRASLDLRLDLSEQSGLELAYTAQIQADGIAQSISAKYARRL